jgi:hypothetical protein
MRETSLNIGEFLAGIKKGSKKYRAKCREGDLKLTLTLRQPL